MDGGEVENRILEIRQKLTLFMNGQAAADMRSRGIDYRLNYGVTLPELRKIASEYQPDHDLAQGLWRQDCRECRILAALLQPASLFTPELADFWLESVEYSDLAEVCCKFLFPKMQNASETAFRWIAGENEMAQYCGFMTIANLMREGREMKECYAQELCDQARTALQAGALLPRQGASVALNIYSETYGKQ